MLLECGCDTASPAKVKRGSHICFEDEYSDSTKSSEVVLLAPKEDCLKIIFIYCSIHLPRRGKKRQLSAT